MKKDFYALKTMSNGTKKLDKKNGDFDATYNVFYHKESNGWAVSDDFTGMSVVVGKPTKKEATDALKNIIDKLTEIRSSEKYLQSVVNYQEMIADNL